MEKYTPEQKEINENRLSESEAHDLANDIKAYIVKEKRLWKRPYGVNENYSDYISPKDYEWASDTVAKIKKLAESESLSEELLTDIVKAFGDVASVPIIIFTAVFEMFVIPLFPYLFEHHPKDGEGTSDLLDFIESLRARAVPGRIEMREIDRISNMVQKIKTKKV